MAHLCVPIFLSHLFSQAWILKGHCLGKKPQWIRSQTKVIRPDREGKETPGRKMEESFEIGKAAQRHS